MAWSVAAWLDELGVAESDGDGRAQLVRDVLQELALLVEQAQVVLGDALDLLHAAARRRRSARP